MPEEGANTRYSIPQEPGTKEPQYSINKSNIKVPVDIQDALEILESLMDSVATPVSITLDKRGYGFVQAVATADPGKTRTYLIEFSFDNARWYPEYTSGVPELNINRSVSSSARYWRLTATDTLASGGEVDLILGATQSS
jgi:hypothetical protein